MFISISNFLFAVLYSFSYMWSNQIKFQRARNLNLPANDTDSKGPGLACLLGGAWVTFGKAGSGHAYFRLWLHKPLF